jgi:hypothetical protein
MVMNRHVRSLRSAVEFIAPLFVLLMLRAVLAPGFQGRRPHGRRSAVM